jgi:FtsH-binding integral membrane protein
MNYGNEYALERDHSSSMSAERAAFIRRTYAHLAGAILAFMGLEAILLNTPGIPEAVIRTLAVSPYSWLIVMVAFIGGGMLAQYWASSQSSRGMQYLGLSLYVVLEALIFLPILIIAVKFSGDPTIIPTAALLTLSVFAGLTAIVFITKKDFNFLGSLLTICSFIAIGVILVAILIPGSFTLGKFFCIAMIVLMAGYILYDTSNVLHHYGEDQHVAASLALFASIATLFWYVVRLLLILSNGGRD